MKYIICNEIGPYSTAAGAITTMDAASEIIMFPQTAVLCMETLTDTTSKIHIQSGLDTDDATEITIAHPDSSAALTHKTFRNLVDDAVRMINNDFKTGVGVMFDALNNVKLPNQTLAGSLITEG